MRREAGGSGSYAVRDQNRDGQININDLRPFHDPAPKWILGHSSYLVYNKFDFGFTLRAYLGNYVYNNVAANLGTYAELNRGSPYNLHNSVLTTGFQNPQYFSDYYVEKASFLRMDNITLGYSFNLRGQRHAPSAPFRTSSPSPATRGRPDGRAERHRQQPLSALAHFHGRHEPPFLSV